MQVGNYLGYGNRLRFLEGDWYKPEVGTNAQDYDAVAGLRNAVVLGTQHEMPGFCVAQVGEQLAAACREWHQLIFKCLLVHRIPCPSHCAQRVLEVLQDALKYAFAFVSCGEQSLNVLHYEHGRLVNRENAQVMFVKVVLRVRFVRGQAFSTNDSRMPNF